MSTCTPKPLNRLPSPLVTLPSMHEPPAACSGGIWPSFAVARNIDPLPSERILPPAAGGAGGAGGRGVLVDAAATGGAVLAGRGVGAGLGEFAGLGALVGTGASVGAGAASVGGAVVGG